MKSLLLVGMALFLVGACGSDGDGGGGGGADAGAAGNMHSCLSATSAVGGSFCADYTGSSWTKAFIEATVCSDEDQTYSSSLCDQTGALFRCDTNLGLPEEQVGWYFGAATEVGAKAHCEGALMGTFTVL